MPRNWSNAQLLKLPTKVLEREMRRDKFTGSRYYYGSGLDMDSLIIGYMAGNLNSDAVAKEVRAHQEIADDMPVFQSSTAEFSRTWPSSSWPESSGRSGGSSNYSNDDDNRRSSSPSSSSWSTSDDSSSSSSSSSSDSGSYSTSDSF